MANDHDGAVSLVQHKILKSSSTSSESSIDSRDIEKEGSSNPLLTSTRENLVPKGVAFAPGVSDFNPRLSTCEPSSIFPPNPMMVQSGGYDPNRIPSSVFTTSRPTTPMEWSVASNESLFSIHMGNTSFSRDHVFLIYKSGEFPENINNPPPSLLPVIAVNNVEKSGEDINKKSKVSEEKFPEPARVEHDWPVNSTKADRVEIDTTKNVNKEKILPVEEIRNSVSSSQSFQFPVLEANGGANGSVKVVMDKKQLRFEQQQHMQAPVTPKKAYGSSWFSCFSCCSLGC